MFPILTIHVNKRFTHFIVVAAYMLRIVTVHVRHGAVKSGGIPQLFRRWGGRSGC